MRFVGALLMVLAALVAGCEPVDAGFLTSQQTGEPLRPMVLPWHVVTDELAYEHLVEEAVATWQRWAARDGVPRDWFVRTQPDDPIPLVLGEVFVMTGTPVNPRAAMETVLDENRQGEIRWATVTMSYAVLDSPPEQLLVWLEHELGHAMRLADDPKELESSIMASPTRVGSSLTRHDFELLVSAP